MAFKGAIGVAAWRVRNRHGEAVANTAVPTHDGTAPVIGTEINGTPGTWTGSPVLTYQWQRYSGSWADIGGATSIDYTPVGADFGLTLRLAEIPNGNAGAAAYSAATGVVTITGLALWFDASDATTLFQNSNGTTPATANNDPVGYWGDKSGNMRHVTQGTAEKRPLLKTAVQNSLPALRWDGSNDSLSASGFTLTQPNTLVIVCKINEAVSYAFDGGPGPVGRNFLLRQSPNTIMSAGTNLNITSAVVGSMAMMTLIYNGATSVGRVNGTQTTTGAANTQSLVGVNVGSRFDGAAPLNGDICELIFVNAAVSAGNITILESYLNAKWAVF